MTDTGPATIETLVRARARLRPDAVAIEAPGRRPLTYRELDRHLADTGRALGTHGVGGQDRVALVVGNGPEMATAFLAVAARAICAPLNPALRAEEYHRQLARLRPAVLVTDSRPGSPAREVAGALGIPVIDLLRDTEGPAGCFTLAGAPARSRPERPSEAPSRPPASRPPTSHPPTSRPEDVALILPTSGTTSRPKLVPLSHANLCASAADHRGVAARSAPTIAASNVMPLFHIHGLVGALLASLVGRRQRGVHAGLHARAAFRRGWRSIRPTWYTAVPTMHQAVLARAATHRDGDRPLDAPRSSAPARPRCPPRVMAGLEDAVRCARRRGVRHDRGRAPDREQPAAAGRRASRASVGVPTGCEVAILDDAGAGSRAGGVGEIAVRGPTSSAGYVGDAEANAAAFAGRLAPHGRPGVRRRRRLPVHHGAAQGDHQPRRREDRAARGRRGAARASGRGAGRRVRGAARTARRGGGGRRRAATRRRS